MGTPVVSRESQLTLQPETKVHCWETSRHVLPCSRPRFLQGIPSVTEIPVAGYSSPWASFVACTNERDLPSTPEARGRGVEVPKKSGVECEDKSEVRGQASDDGGSLAQFLPLPVNQITNPFPTLSSPRSILLEPIGSPPGCFI